MLKYEREAQRSQEMRREFLERSGAYPAPPDLYALWLYAYLEQGNKITHPRDYPFSRGQLEKDETITQHSRLSRLGQMVQNLRTKKYRIMTKMLSGCQRKAVRET